MRECRCTPAQIQRYVGRVSGPLLDRIDIHVDVPAVRFQELSDRGAPEGEGSAEIRARVIAARARQAERFRGSRVFSNAQMPPRLIRRHCRLDPGGEQLLEQAMTRQGLSARAYDRILKVELLTDEEKERLIVCSAGEFDLKVSDPKSNENAYVEVFFGKEWKLPVRGSTK